MLEAYEAYGNWETMAELVEDMICTVATEVLGTTKILIPTQSRDRQGATNDAAVTESPDLERDHSEPTSPAAQGGSALPHGRASGSDSPQSRDREGATNDAAVEGPNPAYRVIDLGKRPWRRATMAELVHEHVGWRFDKQPLTQDGLDALDSETELAYLRSEVVTDTFLNKMSPAEQLVAVFEKCVEETLAEPTFVTRVPSVIIPLARPCEDDSYFADVYELAIGGQEVSPGYTELNDPDVQAQLFKDQAVEDEGERQKVDDDFLHALKVGMPPAGGMGLGVDRLVMLLLGQPSIRDVLTFPLMRPKAAEAEKSEARS
jgi:lysyl-tRNA synthetase class II